MILDERDYRLVQFCDALSNGIRLRLLLEIREEPRNVASLANELNKDNSTISRHLSILKRSDLVWSETQGRNNYYSLKRPKLIEEFLSLRPLLRREKDGE